MVDKDAVFMESLGATIELAKRVKRLESDARYFSLRTSIFHFTLT